MRYIICILLSLFLYVSSFGQTTIPDIVHQPELFTANYEWTLAGCDVLFLQMEYGKATLIGVSPATVEALRHAIIGRIDLVYSDPPAKKDLSRLTQSRLEALQRLLPDVFLRPAIEFRKIRQTAGTSKAVAIGLQHGFFVYYRPLPAKGSGKEEAKKLSSLLGGEADLTAILADSTVARVFGRQHWEHSFVIADVTGSMYPYTAQLLRWLQLHLTGGDKRYFLFFNEGIYTVYTDKYNEVEKTIIEAMEQGSGGDHPENNIEALLESQKICKDCDSIVMIADNWAPIKDISLPESYHRPVKVVLCGVLGRINPDYLTLARDTKGSVHLMEEDIYGLSRMKEGETIRIHGVTYKLIAGRFVAR